MEKNKEIPIGARYHYKVWIEDKETGRPSMVKITMNNDKEAAELIRAFWDMHAQTSLETDQKNAKGRLKLELFNPFKDFSDEQMLEQLTYGARTMINRLYDADDHYKEKKEFEVLIKNNGGRSMEEEAVEALRRLGFNLKP